MHGYGRAERSEGLGRYFVGSVNSNDVEKIVNAGFPPSFRSIADLSSGHLVTARPIPTFAWAIH